MKLTYLGHAAFLLEGKKTLLFDPWLVGNPLASSTLEEIKQKPIDYILVSHGHRDHGFEEAVEIAKEKGKIVGVFELTVEAQKRGAINTIGANVGSTVKIEDDIKLFLAPALHSCPFAVPTGFVIKIENKVIYHAGDTGLTKDLEIVGRFKPDIALIPIGGHFTLGLDEIDDAKEMIKAKRYIGMHYDTFPPIRINKEEAKKKVELVNPGTTIEI